MVQKIDEALLRRRAEHNEGILSTLKEVSLHQFDIEKIENLDIYCRNLEILYLQSNQITKIENLHKLKDLKYLQLALNNITRIENLESCESLEKLDLTVNFIKDVFCVENLKENCRLKQLFLVGNPCTELEGYRSFVIYTLPQLEMLDGRAIETSERILARQQYGAIRARLEVELKDCRIVSKDDGKKNTEPVSSTSGEEAADEIKPTETSKDEDLEAKRAEFQSKMVPHTPEARLETARELDKLRQKDLRHLEKKEKKKPILFGPDGRVYQKNEGKWEYKWEETTKCLRLVVQISKFLDTSKIDVDVHPTYITINIKDKILQLLFDEPVKCDTMHCERSKLTGELAITVQKESYKDQIDITKELGKVAVDVKLATAKRVSPAYKRYSQLVEPSEAVDFRNIIKNAKNERKAAKAAVDVGGITEKQKIKKLEEDFVDDPSVPPLC